MVSTEQDGDLRMLRIERVMELFPVSRVTLYRLVREGKFPPPIKLGGTSVWSNRDLREWLENRRRPDSKRNVRREIDDLA